MREHDPYVSKTEAASSGVLQGCICGMQLVAVLPAREKIFRHSSLLFRIVSDPVSLGFV